ncbi:MAG: MaoC family dehydratase N-terminal domain-containing protein [Chloroflexi bacterium]|nr:MaoC family dehydratase N-terminal domain-containing protein [Chloroflexota bacterium]
MSCGKTYLTDEVKALVGVTGERVPASLWGIEREGLRRFCQALMDPDPRYWDDQFARTTKYGETITPAIYCTYLDRTPPGAEDPVTRAFRENPASDGIGGVRRGRGALPDVPTELKRILNAGNEIELYKYPRLGDNIFSQAKYASIAERVGSDGSHMLIVTAETRYTDQQGQLLCITRASTIRR